jgi:hypothetical protein
VKKGSTRGGSEVEFEMINFKEERDSAKTLCTDSEGGGDGGSVTASRSTHNHGMSPEGQRRR